MLDSAQGCSTIVANRRCVHHRLHSKRLQISHTLTLRSIHPDSITSILRVPSIRFNTPSSIRQLRVQTTSIHRLRAPSCTLHVEAIRREKPVEAIRRQSVCHSAGFLSLSSAHRDLIAHVVRLVFKSEAIN